MNNDSKIEVLKKYLKFPKKYPPLGTYNGIGFSLYGYFSTKTIEPLKFKMIWFCIIFVPIIPIGIYLIEEPEALSYNFYGKIGYRNFINLFGFKKFIIFLTSILFSTIGKIISAIIVITIVYFLFKFIYMIF